VRARIRVLHYSIRTKKAYTDWARRFILFHHKQHSKEMGATEDVNTTMIYTHVLNKSGRSIISPLDM
jgi:hypothetical protein